MRVGFRLDANEHVASGHLMRCVGIAKEIKNLGHSAIFFLAEDKNAEYLVMQEIEYKVINGHWNDWDADTERMLSAVREEQIDILVVDSYLVTADFLATLNRTVPVFLLDDICDTRYDVSAALHYSEFPGEHFLADIYRDTAVRVFTGMQFTPLRSEFTKLPGKPKKKQILITTGGTDPYHISLHLTELLASDVTFSNWEILVICGKMNADHDRILALRPSTPNLTVLQNVSNMAELMRESEIAVSAGGITIYELCCLGTAIVGFSFSDDQTDMLERFATRDILLYAGDARQDKNAVTHRIHAYLTDLATDSAKRSQLIHNSSNLTDGHGASRIARKIVEVVTPPQCFPAQ